MFAEFMDLGMAVMTGRNTVVRMGRFDLLVLYFAIGEALFFKSRLEKPAASAATIVIGAVGLHIDKILFAHDRFHDKAQVLGNRVSEGFTDDLARVLDRKLDLEVFVPVGIDFEPPLPDPFGIVFINTFDFAFVFDAELFQSCQD